MRPHDRGPLPRIVPLMHWTVPYIGIPWKEHGRDRNGIDCWGLTRLPLIEIAKVTPDTLPSYDQDYVSVAEKEEVARLLQQAGSYPWVPVEEGQEKEFDIAIFHRGGVQDHIGLVAGLPGQMLHIVEKCDAELAYYNKGHWKFKLIGLYRHVELA